MTAASVTATITGTIEENITTDRIDSIVNALPGKAEVMKEACHISGKAF